MSYLLTKFNQKYFICSKRSMREVIDLLSSDVSDISSFDEGSLSGENPSNSLYFSTRQDTLNASMEAYTYDFERLFSIKGMKCSTKAPII